VGCSVLGRFSNDAGGAFQAERRFDTRPAGIGMTTAANYGIMAVGWDDDLADGGAMVSVSFDQGDSWCPPYKVDTGDLRGGIKITRNAIHIAYSKSIGGRFRVFYRRGVFLPTTARENKTALPPFATLAQNYPNPFNPSTKVSFSVSRPNWVTLKVYDVLGRDVSTLVDKELDTGEHTVDWNAEGLPSGVYYYRLVTGTRLETRKAVLVR
jgi:hypothetical protein